MNSRQVDDYLLTDLIGYGSFGDVYLTQQQKNLNEKYATKVISKSNQFIESLKREIYFLQQLTHENIIKYKDEKETKNNIYLVLEYCNGGELKNIHHRYITENNKPFPEEYVQHIMRQIFNGFYYLHTKNIMHRDIKLENILLKFESDKDLDELNILKSTVKIIDFGFAKSLGENEVTVSICGNPIASDPRIIEGMLKKTIKEGYDDRVDIWSLGIVAFQLLIGRSPFNGRSIPEINELIQIGIYTIPKEINLSLEAATMISALLQHDEKNRFIWEQIFKLGFLNKDVKDFTPIDYNEIDNNSYLTFSTKNYDTIKDLWKRSIAKSNVLSKKDSNKSSLKVLQVINF